MKNVTTSPQPSPFNNPRLPNVTLPNRDNSVSQQLGAILTAVNILGIVRLNLAEAKSDETEGGKTDGGATMAVEASIITACNRIDEMISEGSRWSVDLLDKLETQMLGLYEQQQKMFEAQTRLSDEVAAPHSAARPQLLRLQDGNWAALVGDPNTASCIIGVGPNPADALKNFDEVFHGGTANLPKAFLEKYENQLGASTIGAPEPKPEQRSPDAGPKTQPRSGRSEKKTMASKRKKPKKRSSRY